VSLYGMVLTF